MAIVARTARTAPPVAAASSSPPAALESDAPPSPRSGRITLSRLATNRKKLAFLLRRVERLRRGGRPREAAAYAQMAADFATNNHTGLLSSRALEESLLAIGREASGSVEPAALDDWRWPGATGRAEPSPARVLHVMSRALATGGHTRLVWRWIRSDARRSHAVAFTRQGAWNVPPELAEAVERSDGRLFYLGSDDSDLITRGVRLRRLAGDADFVVLHVAPFDVVPLIAFADPLDLPPIAFMNHADHGFWIGRSVGNIFLHFREAGRRHSIARRGLDGRLTALLPLPIESVHRELSRAEAKARLGCPASGTVLVSVGWGYKYLPLGSADFGQVHAELLRDSPGTTLFVIGPDRDSRWVRHEKASRGRLRVVPACENLSLYHAAMDIYLGSFPLTSLTSTLEAVLYSVPVVTFESTGSKVFGLDDPSLHQHIHRSLPDYLTHIWQLIADHRLRERVGDDLARSTAHAHTGEGWLEWLESAYRRGFSLRRERAGHFPGESATPIDHFDRLLVRLHSRSRKAKGLKGSIVGHWRLLPTRLRIRALLIDIAFREPARAWKLLWQYLRSRFRRSHPRG